MQVLEIVMEIIFIHDIYDSIERSLNRGNKCCSVTQSLGKVMSINEMGAMVG